MGPECWKEVKGSGVGGGGRVGEGFEMSGVLVLVY